MVAVRIVASWLFSKSQNKIVVLDYYKEMYSGVINTTPKLFSLIENGLRKEANF